MPRILKPRIDEMLGCVRDNMIVLQQEIDSCVDKVTKQGLRHRLFSLERNIQSISFLRLKTCFRLEYPGKDFDIEALYVDQAPYNSSYYDRNFLSVYLPYGLKQMESSLAKMIIYNPWNFSNDEIGEMIKRNPHLHNVIKTNLLDNLKNVH